jgi:hypothetical protein
MSNNNSTSACDIRAIPINGKPVAKYINQAWSAYKQGASPLEGAKFAKHIIDTHVPEPLRYQVKQQIKMRIGSERKESKGSSPDGKDAG